MIGRKAAIGGAMMVGARLLTRLIDLGTLLILARILKPRDFGLVAIAMSLLFIVETALELPLNQALVRLPVVTRAQYDTAFTLSLLRGLVLTLILVCTAWPFAQFYGDGRLVDLILVLSISSVSRGLSSPLLAEYQKSMSFWRDLIMEVGGKLVGFSASITVALLTSSYWALAAGTVMSPVATVVLSYVLVPYKPRLTFSELRMFTGFLGWTSAAQIISAFNWQFERLLLGKLQAKRQLGFFTTANDIATMPFMMLFGPILRPLLAAFSLMMHDTPRLARSYQTASAAIITIGLPLLVGESLVAGPAVRLILGEQWLPAIPLLRWLALSTIPALLAMPASPLFMSLDQTKLLFRRNLLEFCIKFPSAVIGGIQFGFNGIIAARFLSETVAGIFCMMVIKRKLSLPISRQIGSSWRSIVSTLVMIPPVMGCEALCSALPGAAGAAMSLAASGVAGALVYGGMLALLWRLSGRPPGAEAMIAAHLENLIRRKLPSAEPSHS